MARYMGGPPSLWECVAFAAVAVLNYESASPAHRDVARKTLDAALDVFSAAQLRALRDLALDPSAWEGMTPEEQYEAGVAVVAASVCVGCLAIGCGPICETCEQATMTTEAGR